MRTAIRPLAVLAPHIGHIIVTIGYGERQLRRILAAYARQLQRVSPPHVARTTTSAAHRRPGIGDTRTGPDLPGGTPRLIPWQ